jgi:hypothetical protein
MADGRHRFLDIDIDIGIDFDVGTGAPLMRRGSAANPLG